MYQGNQRHVLGNDPTRAFQVPPPPPMSPPVVGAPTMNSMMGTLPPPPPRYAPTQGATTGPNVLIPPPPSGPPPGSALNQQAPWQGQFGRIYDSRAGFIPPPPPGGQHVPYNPKLHAALSNGQSLTLPPMPANELVGPTYIPSGDTFGEGVGIPGFRHEDYNIASSSQGSWSTLTPQPPAEQSVTTPLDDPSLRERVQTGNTTRPSEQASASSSAIPAEVAAQWPIDTVLIWLAKNQFSKEWQQTFSALDISGSQFLEMGVKKGSPKTSQMIHLHVYPRLKEECHASGNTFDQAKEREEVKRMRRLINNILTGKTVEPTKASIGLQGRKESTTSRTGSATLSAGTEPESPSVSLFSSGRHFRWSCINMS
jgi:mitogen-activated protein kinase kinase kinase